MEHVDILQPPDFHKSGVVKPKKKALADEDWLGIFHLWILQDEPLPAIVYQQRSPNASWGPNLLDVSVGGHYQAGESRLDGLREVKEEVGIDYDPKLVKFLGRKIFFGTDENNHERHSVVDVHFVKDNRHLHQYMLEAKEIHALCLCPIDYLIKLHTRHTSFKAPAITATGQRYILEVKPELFPYNWDNYHLKIALLAKRYLKGEKNLIY
jgi:8-oxo-dGTP pyrophosphatase MutT (NUDIX family)